MAVLRALDPEVAHGVALRALAAGLGPRGGAVVGPPVMVAGLALPNPVGIAAGFDKNATALPALLACGAGFVEIGAITPRPQPGNPRPRLFRLAADRAAINRFGFNNDGMAAVRPRLLAARGLGVVGVNLGAGKDSADRAADFAAVLAHLYDAADFFTINVSSPNTERLRDLQGAAALDRLLGQVMACRAGLPGARRPVLLKVAPDLDEAGLADIARLVLAHGLDGVIATNTTLAREGLADPLAAQAGGLSGAPLFARSTQVLARLYHLTGGAVPLIGVGGIASAADAYAKIRAGASAVQLYTAMVYGGIRLPGRIARDLGPLLARDGFASVAEAVGADHRGAGPPTPPAPTG